MWYGLCVAWGHAVWTDRLCVCVCVCGVFVCVCLCVVCGACVCLCIVCGMCVLASDNVQFALLDLPVRCCPHISLA